MDTAELFSLRGRVAMITGASSGLGERFAEVAAANGAKVVLVARRADRLDALKARIEQSGGSALVTPADVTNATAVAAAFDAAEQTFGTVDLFVANAGIRGRGKPLEVTPDGWREVMSTNLDAVFFSCQEAARRMIAARKPGAIIAISSIAGLLVPLQMASYAVAKAAVIQATKLLAFELGPSAIRVNCIAPGWIMTDISQDFLTSEAGLAATARHPLPGFGKPSDLDGAFLLLASEAGRIITGTTIVVDSGRLVGEL
jgi:3-oxoacyl-[acyl-carrier protein] reductase